MATAWSTIPTFTAGNVLTGAQMTTVANNLNLAGNGPTAFCVAKAAQSIAAGTVTAINFGTGSEVIDNDAMHSESTQPARFTCVTPGWYEVSGAVCYSSPTGSNPLQAFLRKFTNSTSTTDDILGSNGYGNPASSVNALGYTVRTPVVMVNLAVNDYIFLAAYHEQGSTKDTYVGGARGETSSILVRWVAPS